MRDHGDYLILPRGRPLGAAPLTNGIVIVVTALVALVVIYTDISDVAATSKHASLMCWVLTTTRRGRGSTLGGVVRRADELERVRRVDLGTARRVTGPVVRGSTLTAGRCLKRILLRQTGIPSGRRAVHLLFAPRRARRIWGTMDRSAISVPVTAPAAVSPLVPSCRYTKATRARDRSE